MSTISLVRRGEELPVARLPSVTRLAVGCNSFGRSVDSRGARSIVSAALANGINFFDTADVYGDPPGSAEELLGEALKGIRSRAVIATKFGFPMSRVASTRLPSGHGVKAYVFRAVDASLARLRTDYLDLLQMHIPDPATPLGETLSAFAELLSAGKVRAIGLSRFDAKQIADWLAVSTVISSVQAEYSLLCHGVEHDLLPLVATSNLAFLACLPLASGLLTGKYRRSAPIPPRTRFNEPAFAEWYETVPWQKIDDIRRFAAARSMSMLSVALGYLLGQATVSSVIVGVTSAQQVVENVHAATWQPDAVDIHELRRLAHQRPDFPARVPWEKVKRR